jgi:hypothetical protein
MLHAHDVGELVGISHKKQVETSIVDFLYLYFPLQISPIEPDAQHFPSHNSCEVHELPRWPCFQCR